MNVYTAIQDFSLPTLCSIVHVGDTVGKIFPRTTTVVDGVENTNLAFFQWVGSLASAPYLVYTGIIPDPPVAGVYTGVGGSQSVAMGQDFVTVSGTDFGFVPTSIVVTVVKPDGSASNIFGTVRQDSISQTGFTADFSTPIPGAGYYLAYYAAPLSGQGGPSISQFDVGSVLIPSGVAEVTVVQAFGFVPDTVIVSVTKPDGSGFNVFATVKQDTITGTGFVVDLSATTGSTGYMLNYLVKAGG